MSAPIDLPDEEHQCSRPKCRAAAAGKGELCIWHRAPDAVEATVKKQMENGALDLCGVAINPQLLSSVIAAAAPPETERPHLP